MANRTDPTAIQIHGTNPQNLIEKILRSKIYGDAYWKEHCFALTAETIVDHGIIALRVHQKHFFAHVANITVSTLATIPKY